ncbi:hypothetical protein JL101_031200 (plasmid) [Skermanella rosea]|uniref:hypothetical protein n=1 Tax=Skermanella rosea TaxID=1817965 RepID=UPI0019313DFC|nr:hypothetical protein [Skermanella rosea]UEM06949.1 hypothetical protein JL101_031200 [Skermanella rosea]
MNIATVLARAALASMLSLAPAQAAVPDDPRPPDALTLFGARLTDNSFEELLTAEDLTWRDSYLVGVAASRRVWEFGRHAEIDLEGQVVRHFGNERHWEFNALPVARWLRFPWSESVHTGVAYGLGLSYATRKPAEEVAMNGSTEHWLVYWVIEAEVGPPARPWSAVARLHHRSPAFGLMGDAGGANSLTAGVRWRY